MQTRVIFMYLLTALPSQTGITGVPNYVQEAITGVVNLLSQLVGVVVILLTGWALGRTPLGVARRGRLVPACVRRWRADCRPRVCARRRHRVRSWRSRLRRCQYVRLVPGRPPDTESSPVGQTDGGEEPTD